MELFNSRLHSRSGRLPPPYSPGRHVGIGMEIPFREPAMRRRGMLEFPETLRSGTFPGQGCHRDTGHRVSEFSQEMVDPHPVIATGRRKAPVISPSFSECSFPFPGRGVDCHTSRSKHRGPATSLQTRLTIPPHFAHHHSYLALGCSSHHCGCGSIDNSEEKFPFKTKDICVRGKAYKVRASYLAEAPKFEADLIKYVDKRKEDVVPPHVVKMLVDFINYEKYSHEGGPLDEAKLNILASNVGAKSVVDFSLDVLKQNFDCDVPVEDLCDTVTTVMLSVGVTDALKEWLKKYLAVGQRLQRLFYHEAYAELVHDHPEVETRLEVLFGMRKKEEDGKYKAM